MALNFVADYSEILMDLGKLLSTSEAARRAGIHRQTLSRAIKRGRIKIVEVGGRPYITPRELARYLRIKDKKSGRPRLRRKQ